MGNGYSELTDPLDQLERLLAQRRSKRREAKGENHPVDADFVKALGCGMPPAGRVGLGIDRLVMLLADAGRGHHPISAGHAPRGWLGISRKLSGITAAGRSS